MTDPICLIKNLYKQSRVFTTLGKKSFENIVGKGENTGNQHFLFQQCSPSFQEQIPSLGLHLFCRLQMFSVCTCRKFCLLVKS